MAHKRIICGIDIGNSAIKTAVGLPSPASNRIQIVGVASTPSDGLRRGMVVDMEEVINNISQSVSRAEQMAGLKINRAYVSINGLHIRTQPSHGIIAVSRADNEISQYDIDRVIDAAAAVSLPANREIIHIIPRSFIIDGQEHVKSALGMRGVRLEAEVLLIEGLSPYIRNLAKCLNANDIEVAEFVFGPLAAAKAVLDKHQLEHGVMNIDFGGGVSSLAMFHEGELVHTAVLPVGSRHITNDIAIAFRTSMDKAEDIKCQHAFVGSDETSGRILVDLSDVLDEEGFVVPKKQISKIVDARVSELFDMISSEIKKIPRGNLLPAGVVLAGGGANLAGLSGLTKNRLKLSVQMARGNSALIEGLGDKTSDPAFAVSLGLVIWGAEKELAGKGGGFSLDWRENARKVSKWFKNFLP